MDNQPKTIEELRQWFEDKGYESAKTRFFIGIDYKAPKAFGIYKDELGEFVVYKNKADGTRAIRYQGCDEEFAVHEIYQRFQEEIINQQTRWAADHASGTPALQRSSEPQNPIVQTYLAIPKKLRLTIITFVATLALTMGLTSFVGRRNGYYSINNNLYYRAGNDWYYYDNSDKTWGPVYNIPYEFTSSGWNDYSNTDSYNSSYRSFESTSYYEEWRSSQDSDSWDSDSWDSDYTDWSSDW